MLCTITLYEHLNLKLTEMGRMNHIYLLQSENSLLVKGSAKSKQVLCGTEFLHCRIQIDSLVKKGTVIVAR